MAKVVVTDNRGEKVVELTEELITIGRSSKSTIPIRDHMSSRNHCEIRKVGGGFRLVDLESSNGTQVNGKDINQHSLLDGDEIQIGDVTLLFQSSDLARPKSKSSTSPSRPAQRSHEPHHSNSAGTETRTATKKIRRRRGREKSGSGAEMLIYGASIVVGIFILIFFSQNFLNSKNGQGRKAYDAANFHLEQGEWDKAIQAIKLIPNDAKPWATKGRELLALITAQRDSHTHSQDRISVDKHLQILLRLTEEDLDDIRKKRGRLATFIAEYRSQHPQIARKAEKAVEALVRKIPESEDPLTTALKESNRQVKNYRFARAREILFPFQATRPEARDQIATIETAARNAFEQLMEKASNASPKEALRIYRQIENFGMPQYARQAKARIQKLTDGQ